MAFRKARVTTLDENEHLDVDRYVKREGVDEQQPLNFTLFRQKERFYKQNPDKLDEAINFANLTGRASEMVEKLSFENSNVLVYGVKSAPGLYLLPGYLRKSEQKQLLTNVFAHELNLKNKNSLTAVYNLPQEETFYDQLKLHGPSHTLTLKRQDRDENIAHSLEEWIRKIRWINLGLYYDWNTKSYDFNSNMLEFSFIQMLSRRVCEEIGLNIKPEAGIINYYQLNDSLTGHIDRYEKDMSTPLVSFSVGNSCVFLMGGAKRDDNVTSIILNSGDALIMSKECRRYYHGVPKILNFSIESFDDDNDFEFSYLIKNSRININVRQVN
jgi:alkylated DNA repair protein alkB family protein 1